MSYCVYILFSEKLSRFYVGMTENLDQRILHHNNPIRDLKFTAKGIPWKIFLSIPCHSKNHALKLERLIKSKKSRIFIENLKKYPELIEKTLKAASDS
ncbi:MAG TPA: GIY-YIG nuclease family protein [Chryseolinea sp.]|nr:GIY-YIG nuclease family protein [Chryseolinea sp.]HPH45884.1 GIY-YIG nuclease family protein [Chryseolinea sp.]HPM29507.1 GIY-YIG nuclease family protein [Chryseolinea sp.]